MAFSDDQQPDFKHFCRICKKGFMCGRALGGHMRAHGVSDETGDLDDEDPGTDNWDGNRKMYALRTNPNRFTRVCENCGKEFLSWKSFLEHGKCGSDDAESSLVWSPESEGEDDDDGGGGGCYRGSGWSKRKRSFRVCSSEDEEDVALAKCLMALSNTRVDPVELEADDRLCATTKREEQRRNPIFSSEFLPTFTKPPPPLDKAKRVVVVAATTTSSSTVAATATTPKGMFECKACKKVFNSHQALGGHRASHKNVKGCFAARNDHFDDNSTYNEDFPIVQNEFKSIITCQPSETGPNPGPVSLAGRKSKVHKCSICSRIFASGQALGGHKRCHWLTTNYTAETSLNKFNFHEHIDQLHRRALAIPKKLELNLNLPVSGNTTTAGARPDMQNPARLDGVSTEINLHAWSNAKDQENACGDAKEDHKHQLTDNNGDQDDRIPALATEIVEDEGESKVKLAKLSELKEMNDNDGSSSSWLQVGIGSTTDVAPN
ncbi:hypothetical protein L6452_33092 [Arctium lappa]|uniref:Uncharacterized protein n=1 Tax=Arctium lappa TaxID=4217 RepID=A0ACB8Z6C4_ARCLA|nr:hypothetical protein L6452_33092 [Arctium lappa]